MSELIAFSLIMCVLVFGGLFFRCVTKDATRTCWVLTRDKTVLPAKLWKSDTGLVCVIEVPKTSGIVNGTALRLVKTDGTFSDHEAYFKKWSYRRADLERLPDTNQSSTSKEDLK